MVTGVLSLHLTEGVQFYEKLLGFCLGRGTGTASLKAELFQNRTSIR